MRARLEAQLKRAELYGQIAEYTRSCPCSVAMWLVFSDTWNAIVDELRGVDLLSERERRNLIFLHLPIDDTVEVCVQPQREGGPTMIHRCVGPRFRMLEWGACIFPKRFCRDLHLNPTTRSPTEAGLAPLIWDGPRHHAQFLTICYLCTPVHCTCDHRGCYKDLCRVMSDPALCLDGQTTHGLDVIRQHCCSVAVV